MPDSQHDVPARNVVETSEGVFPSKPWCKPPATAADFDVVSLQPTLAICQDCDHSGRCAAAGACQIALVDSVPCSTCPGILGCDRLDRCLGVPAAAAPKHPELDALIEQAVERYRAMTPAEKAEEHRKQADSWVRGEIGMGSDKDEAACRDALAAGDKLRLAELDVQSQSRIDRFNAAVAAVTDERGNAYGHPKPNFDRVSRLMAVVAECQDPLARHALEMICVKVARLIHTPDHLDSWVDIAGYARTGVMVTD